MRLTCLMLMLGAAWISACGGGTGAGRAASATLAVRAASPAVVSPTPAPESTVQPRPRHIIAIDAGHGGPRTVGASHRDATGATDLVEKDLNLDVARRIERLLRAAGYGTAMIRDGDYGLSPFDSSDFTANVRAESQARADAANATGADIMLVIHFNGSDDAAQSGTEVYFDPDRAFGDANRRLANAVHDGLIASLRALPYAVHDRGVKDDAPIGARFGQAHTFLLGEAAAFRPTRMPAIIIEALFVSNDGEAALLQRDEVREAIARGYIAGVRAYFGE